MAKRIVIFLVFILILLRLIIYYRYFQGWEVYFFSDNAVYAILARRFLNGDFLGAIHPFWNPGFPIATIPFYLLVGSWEKAQILISMVSATVLILAVFFFFKRFSLIFAFITAFIVTFASSLQHLVLVEGITEPLYLLVTWLAIFFGFLAVVQKKIFFYALSGLFFAFAYLTRTDVIGIFLSYLIFLLFYIVFKERPAGLKAIFKISARNIGIVLLMFILINLPYFIILSHHLDRPTFTGKYASIGAPAHFLINNYSSKRFFSTWAQDVWGVDYINYKSLYYDPGRATRSFLKNWNFIFWTKKTFVEVFDRYTSARPNNFFVGIGFGLTVLGFFLGLWQKRFRLISSYLFVLWFGEIIWISLFMSPINRYLTFALPYFFYLQAVAIYFITSLLSKSYLFFLCREKRIQFLEKGILLGSTILLLSYFFAQNVKTISHFSSFAPIKSTGHLNSKIIGDWVKSQGIKVIGTRHEAIGFYGDATTIYTPSATPDEIVNYLKFWGVEYLIINDYEINEKDFRLIGRKDFKHPDLKLVKTFKSGAVVWKINLTDKNKF